MFFNVKFNMGGFLSHKNNRNSSNFDNISRFDNEYCSQTVNNRKRLHFSNNNLTLKNKDESSLKRFKIELTSHVFEKMFLESYYSDVTIHALGHKWHLHRVYLEQCDYFKALFDGNWLDSKKNEYEIKNFDKNVTYDGLFYFFLYFNNKY